MRVEACRDLAAFVRLPRALHRPTSPWVRPLDAVERRRFDPRLNPYFREAEVGLFIARRGERPAGRIAAHRSRRYAALHDDAGLFGFFEAADQEAADALLDAAQSFVGRRTLRGPLSFTSTQEMGLLVGGFEHAPGFTMTHNPAAYPEWVERAGFCPCLRMSTSFGELSVDPASLLTDRHRETMRDLRLTLRPSTRRRLPDDLDVVRDLMNAAFLNQPHFVPVTPEAWAFQMSPGRPYLDPALVLVAEVRGVPVGALLAVPDFNRILSRMDGSLWHPAAREFFLSPPSDRAVILAAAVHPAYQGVGLGRLLYAGLLRMMQGRGYRAAYGSWIARGNVANQRQVEAIGLRPLHELALFERAA